MMASSQSRIDMPDASLNVAARLAELLQAHDKPLGCAVTLYFQTILIASQGADVLLYQCWTLLPMHGAITLSKQWYRVMAIKKASEMVLSAHQEDVDVLVAKTAVRHVGENQIGHKAQVG